MWIKNSPSSVTVKYQSGRVFTASLKALSPPAALCEICPTTEFFLVRIYMFKVNNRNSRTRCEICSKLTIKTLERHHWRRSGVFIVNFKHLSHLALVFLFLTLSR